MKYILKERSKPTITPLFVEYHYMWVTSSDVLKNKSVNENFYFLLIFYYFNDILLNTLSGGLFGV